MLTLTTMDLRKTSVISLIQSLKKMSRSLFLALTALWRSSFQLQILRKRCKKRTGQLVLKLTHMKWMSGDCVTVWQLPRLIRCRRFVISGMNDDCV